MGHGKQGADNQRLLLALSRKAGNSPVFKIACIKVPPKSSGMTQSGPEPRYEVARKGTTLGTYGLSEVAAEIASGNLAWTDDCWTEGMESWCKLADIKDQVDALAAVVIASPSAPSRTLLYVGVACISLLSVGAGRRPSR